MNSRQLCWILSNDKVTSKICEGVYALDEIKHIKQISFSPREIKDFLCIYAEGWNYNHVSVRELYSTTCGQFVNEHVDNLTMSHVLVRDFVKMHYQFSAKVMDPNFIRCVVKEIECK